MIPRIVRGATHVLGAPEGEKHRCGKLYVRMKDGVYESAWEPTPAELAAINAGASIILRIVGVQPMVMLCVESDDGPVS